VALVSGSAAAGVASLLAWLGPPGSDLAAHVYQRTLFLHDGFALWNNFWYAGRYSYVTYSLLYYPLAALFGIRLLAVATIATAAYAFAIVLGREWGPAARWSSRTFAVVWAGIVLSAAFPFALGAALALLAIWALQADARWRFGTLAILTLAASPVAFLLLVIVLAGIALGRRVSLSRCAMPAAAVLVAGFAELMLALLFPGGGRYPFSLPEAIAGAVFCLLGLAFTWRVETLRIMRWIFVVYLAASIVAYLVPSAVGENVERLRYAAIPLAVLVFSLRSWRPLVPALVVIGLAVSWNVTPLVASYAKGTADPAADASFWTPAVRYLHAHLTPSFRVEAVDTSGHWPAVYLARADIPLARGWFRQDDFPQNEVLYSRLGARAYVQWLHGLGVRYVVLTSAPPDYSAKAEAVLVRSGRAGLVPVLQTRQLTVYEVPNARPIVAGAGPANVVELTQSRIALSLPRGRGWYRLAVRWSPYWKPSDGCVWAGRDGMMRIAPRGARSVTLAFDVDASGALDALAGTKRRCTTSS
jgi:hypothetical protein